MASIRDHLGSRFFEQVATYQFSCRLLLLNTQTAQSSEVQHDLAEPDRPGLLASSKRPVKDPLTSGLLGLVLDAQLRSVRPPVSLELAALMVKDWKAFITASSLERCAGILLGADSSTTGIGDGASTSVVADVELMAALGQAMMSRGNYSKAYAMLTHYVDEFRRQKIKNPQIEEPGFFYNILLDFIKCCNINKIQDMNFMLSKLSLFEPASSLLQCYKAIGLADWYIGQGIYAAAESYLNKVSSQAEIPNYLKVITNLRLNKIHRRLRSLDASTLKEGGPLFQALKNVDHTNADMSNECLDELRATISFARWNGFDVAADARAVLAANPTIPKENWRLSALEDQCKGLRACILTRPANEDPMATGEESGFDLLDDDMKDYLLGGVRSKKKIQY